LRDNYNILIGAKFKISKNIIIHMSNTNKMGRVINKYTWCASVQVLQEDVRLLQKCLSALMTTLASGEHAHLINLITFKLYPIMLKW
jgi:hypothetical protein